MYFYFLLKLPSLHLPIHPSNSLLVFLSHYIFVIRLSVCMSFSLYGVMSVWRFLCLSVFLSVRILSVSLSVCLAFCRAFCLPGVLFVCLSAWLTLWLSGFQYGCLSIDLCTRLCFGVSLLKFMKGSSLLVSYCKCIHFLEAAQTRRLEIYLSHRLSAAFLWTKGGVYSSDYFLSL